MAGKLDFQKICPSTISLQDFTVFVCKKMREIKDQWKTRVEDNTDCWIVSCGDLKYKISKGGKHACRLDPAGFPLPFQLFINCKKVSKEFNNLGLIGKLEDELGIKKNPHQTAPERRDIFRQDEKKARILYKILRSYSHSKKFNGFLRGMMSVVWKKLNPEALGIGIKTIGMGVSNIDFNFIAANLDEIRGIFERTPGLIPLWLYAKRNKIVEDLKEKRKPSTDIADRQIDDEEFYHFSKIPNLILRHEDLNIWKTESVVSDVQWFLHFKKIYSNKLWRYICNMPPRWVRSTIIKCQDNYLGYCLELLSEIQILPKFSTLKEVVERLPNFAVKRDTTDSLWRDDFGWRPDYHISYDTVVSFLRTAFRASLKKPAKTFYNAEISLVRDSLYDSPVDLDRNQRNAPWSWYMRKQVEWHEAYEERQRLIREERERQNDIDRAEQKKLSKFLETNYSWVSLIDKKTVLGHTVFPLTTKEEMEEEGRKMSHCIGSYAHGCYENRSRVFSIRNKNGRVATLEIIPDYGSKKSWRVNHCYGYHNATVDSVVSRVAKYICGQYNKAEADVAKQSKQQIPVCV